MKKILLFITLIICIYSNFTFAADTYDVILFWGQSNMVGSVGSVDDIEHPEEEMAQHYNHDDVNERQAFSKQTGIDMDIVQNDKTLNYVTVPLESGVALEYMELSHTFEDINSKAKFGEWLKYNENTNTLQQGSTDVYNNSIQGSFGTNMIPWFCKTYYEKTGHRIVVVFAANGGKDINCFLPVTDLEHNTDPSVHYIYEAMVKKYNNAIYYMQQNGWKVGKRLFVAYQGENDFFSGLSTDVYANRFQRVIDNLKKDIGITGGAIVESGGWVDDNHNTNYDSLKNINIAQKRIAENNADVIIGSTYPYEHTLPADSTIYYSEKFDSNFFNNFEGGKPTYEDAVAYTIKTRGLNTYNNQIHFSSAALSQIGKEVATSMATKLDLKYEEVPSKAKLIHPTYETNDSIVADYVISPNVDEDFDMTDTIQNALFDCRINNKGGTVYLESGIYRVTKPITIPSLCTLRGDYQDPDTVSNTNELKYGTIIKVDVDNFNYEEYKYINDQFADMIQSQTVNGDIEKAGLFRIEDSAGAVGLTIYYENQSLSNIKEQPWTFYYVDNVACHRNLLKTIKNITMINSYRGIGVSLNETRAHEMLMIENVKGTVLKSGVVVHNSQDVGTITGLTLKPDYWANANLSALGVSGTPPTISQITAYTKDATNLGTGLTITDAEQQQYVNIDISGYYYGILIPNCDSRIMGSGLIYNLNITNCNIGMMIEKGYHYGIWMPGSELYNPNALLPMLDFSTGCLISNSYIEGDVYAIVNHSSEKPGSEIGAPNVSSVRGLLKLNDVTIIGNTSDGTEANLNYNTIPGIYVAYNDNYIPVGNGYHNDIIKSNKFNNIELNRVTKSTGSYFAEVDDSITAVGLNLILNDAYENGGGVVYLRPGLYNFSNTINVPENVELRGSSSVSVRTAGKRPMEYGLDGEARGTVINVGTMNLTQAVINLQGDNAGVSGITFIYKPNIDKLKDNANCVSLNYDRNHPRVIYSQNTNGAYVTNVAMIASSYGIIFDGCSDFTISNLVTGLLENVIYLNGCSNGIIKNCLQNMSLLSRNDLYYYDENLIINNIFMPISRNVLKYIVVENSNDIDLQNNFIYGGFVYLESNNSSIYAINNGNDGFGDNGWQYSFVNSLEKPSMLINSLRCGGYSTYNEETAMVGIYNRDYFFKFLANEESVEVEPDKPLKFTVTFVNEDGTILQSTQVDCGTMPAYTGITPTKEAQGQQSYIFNGWTPNVEKVTANVVYTATYELASQWKLGDVNKDGKITILDVRLLLQEYINANEDTVYEEADLKIMDMDDNKKINILDVRLLLQLYINTPN